MEQGEYAKDINLAVSMARDMVKVVKTVLNQWVEYALKKGIAEAIRFAEQMAQNNQLRRNMRDAYSQIVRVCSRIKQVPMERQERLLCYLRRAFTCVEKGTI
ncbi:MAG: hypothetical protein DRP82_00325 [Planctomycetota bacterium]|nr:MAG: hypothetical protein DRP82_00325 [Planctomycetota bacterium]